MFAPGPYLSFRFIFCKLQVTFEHSFAPIQETFVPETKQNLLTFKVFKKININVDVLIYGINIDWSSLEMIIITNLL